MEVLILDMTSLKRLIKHTQFTNITYITDTTQGECGDQQPEDKMPWLLFQFEASKHPLSPKVSNFITLTEKNIIYFNSDILYLTRSVHIYFSMNVAYT